MGQHIDVWVQYYPKYLYFVNMETIVKIIQFLFVLSLHIIDTV